MGIDLTISSGSSERYIPATYASDVITTVMARRNPDWKLLGTPCLKELLSADDIANIVSYLEFKYPDDDVLFDIIHGYEPDYPYDTPSDSCLESFQSRASNGFDVIMESH